MPWVRNKLTELTKPSGKDFKNQTRWQKAVTVGRVVGELSSDTAGRIAKSKPVTSARKAIESRKESKALAKQEKDDQGRKVALRKKAEAEKIQKAKSEGRFEEVFDDQGNRLGYNIYPTANWQRHR